jgi:hypothetical protein
VAGCEQKGFDCEVSSKGESQNATGKNGNQPLREI